MSDASQNGIEAFCQNLAKSAKMAKNQENQQAHWH
jgi:hypothetical protein